MAGRGHLRTASRRRENRVIQSIDTDQDWRAARNRIDALCAAAGAAPFAAPDWLDAAMAWQAPGVSLRMLTAGDVEHCRGFAPLALGVKRLAGLPARTLQFITVPDTQFADLACAGSEAAAFCAELAGWLAERRRDWDCLRLHYLSDLHSNWRPLEGALAQAGVGCAVEPAGVNPHVDLAGSFGDYYSARSRKLKKAVNLSANRLARAGAVSIDWVRGGDGVDTALAEAIRVSALSWKQQTGNSLDRPGPRAFIERLTAAAARSGALSLWLLRLDGRVIATEYQLIAGGNVYALRSDFDPACAEVSPGTYLNHHLLGQLFGRGLRRYYMGPGGNAYKLRWTDTGEPMYRLTAYSPTARGRLLQWLERSARPLARRWRQRLQRAPGKDAEPPA
jgi:CelD/BcsL family acetyltransferase involved in cellulose biosynthesis